MIPKAKDKDDIRGLQKVIEHAYSDGNEKEFAPRVAIMRQEWRKMGGEMSVFDSLQKSIEKDFYAQKKAWDKEQQAKKPEYVGVMMYDDCNCPYDALQCGDWIANSNGVRAYGHSDKKVASRYPITWVRSLKNINTQRFKVTLAFYKRGRWEELTVDKSVISDKSRICVLSAYDFPVTSDTTGYLVEFLADLEFFNSEDIEVLRSTSKLGWQEGKTKEFYPYCEDLIFDGDADLCERKNAIQPAGKPEEWYELVKRIRSTKRIEPLFMLAASFASPLLKILGVQSFVVNLWGNTGGGKSVTSQLAASVWGNPRPGRFMTDFQCTEVLFEIVQDFLNSLPLILDDSATVKNKAFFNMSDFIYRRCNEKGKGRSDKSLGIHDDKNWRQVIIMNGEQPICVEDMQGGAINRTLDLACGHTDIYEKPREVIETIHGSYGHAGKEFVRLIKELGEDEIRTIFNKYIIIVNALDGTSKQTNALAAVLTADELIEKHIFKDGITLELEQVAEVLSTKDFVSEDRRCYDYLIEQSAICQDKFVPVKDSDGSMHYKGDCWGCIDGCYLVIIKTIFDKLCSDRGYSPKRFLNWAKAMNLILQDSKGNPTRLKKIKGQGVRCVFIKQPSEDDDDEEPKNKGNFVNGIDF